MKNLSDYVGKEFEIIGLNFFKFNYDLRVGETTLLSLRSTDFWGKTFEVIGNDKTWLIIKPSIWSSNLEIKEKNTGVVAARLTGSAFKNNSVLHLAKGEKLHITMNIWKSTFEIKNEFGTTLVSFKTKKWYSSDVIATIQIKNDTIDKYPFSLMLAFYIATEKKHHAGAVV
ncbi:MAG: hypothetical protein FD143_2673 [Ignavibacteria bacterium]|nr:MAG: hypothetical protein FD143_2673 [Ignavibacteria bacterium]KAF0156141.1 MAG: hypothetical protein FD188_3032 [Ignavibacteria bacterium]